MEKRRVGNSELMIAPIVFGGNDAWLDRRRGHASFQLLDAFLDGGFNAIDTADTYSRAFVPGRSWRRIGNHHREMAQTGWRAARTRADFHQKLAMKWRSRKIRPVTKIHHGRSGRFAETATGRLHRSLPVASRRSADAHGRNHGGFFRSDTAGESSRDRRVELCLPATATVAGCFTRARVATI